MHRTIQVDPTTDFDHAAVTVPAPREESEHDAEVELMHSIDQLVRTARHDPELKELILAWEDEPPQDPRPLLRHGEFTCSGCHMVLDRRRLADPASMRCADCA